MNEPAIHRTLLIKHVTGRFLLDSRKLGGGFRFSLQEKAGRWVVEASGVEPDVIREVLRLSDELNLFYFEEDTKAGTLRKWWLYDKDTPEVTGHAAEGTLTLSLDTRTPYSNENTNIPM
ncbi:hypothetical protein ACVNS2_14340 [Paenibacillus caseinilyticus]|uniref:Uncharacterized protein n=1 Tax=Paenibacillus mucilaginosus K02 TaxID=997761 RepID=I0BHH1_9BACL|nr:hypothetical protein [Paenibacillus mucilaginosus]AFH61818.1 hypothetical protein B2K_14020 [Paenibacillus mucilaginosus K02]